MKKLTLFLSLALLLGLSSCSITQAIKLKDCHYSYSHISDFTFMDMSSKDRHTIPGAVVVTKALMGKTDEIRMGCTVHMRVYNPNKQTASVDKVFYTLLLDSIQVAEGSSTQPLVVVGESTEDMPLKLSMDLKYLFQKQNKASVINLLKNSINLSDVPTYITIILKPMIRIGTSTLSVPKPIPVTFEYGGKKQE